MHSIYRSDSVVIMGILNVTPDSFSDGGRFVDLDRAVSQALYMVEQGAQIIDVGGESTRPGANAVSVEQELQRVIPVIEALSDNHITISIDTSKAEVMKAAIHAGASMINDVRALLEPNALATAAELKVPVCLMHMQGKPRTMQQSPKYIDVVADVMSFLTARVEACIAAGIDRGLLSIDPGFGFGKTLDHNLDMLRRLDEFKALNLPVLAGISRKSMLGKLTGRDVDNRVAASLAAAIVAMQNGATILRVHDVAETSDAIKVIKSLAWI